MIRLSPAAERQLASLIEHYERLDRPEAIRALQRTLGSAATRIEMNDGRTFSAPRPYPDLTALGLRWIKEGAYWFAYTRTLTGPQIVSVFHEAADIPNRI